MATPTTSARRSETRAGTRSARGRARPLSPASRRQPGDDLDVPRGDVLVVDDDEVVRGMLVWLFEEDGYHVREAIDGAEALKELTAEPPACMILDLMMPVVDGQAVLQRRQEDGLA